MRLSLGTLGKTARIGVIIGISVLFSACQLGEKRVVKAQGLCVVSETAEPVTVNALDSRHAAGYLPQSTFGPGEQPMAVVVGYGGRGASLELVDLHIGRTLGAKTLDSHPGEASFQPLQIDTSGEYELRLLVDGVQQDTCKFSVTRKAAPAAAPATAADATSIPAGLAQGETYFPDYDANLRSHPNEQQATNDLNIPVKTVQ